LRTGAGLHERRFTTTLTGATGDGRSLERDRQRGHQVGRQTAAADHLLIQLTG
jgi:hypothetical protein